MYKCERTVHTTDFGEHNIGLEIFQVAAAPIVVAAFLAGDLTLNLY